MKRFNDQKCQCENINKSTFQNWNDYDDFYMGILSNSEFCEIAVLKKMWEIGCLEEKWFECLKCKKTWSLIEPDPPFKGFWKLVNVERN